MNSNRNIQGLGVFVSGSRHAIGCSLLALLAACGGGTNEVAKPAGAASAAGASASAPAGSASAPALAASAPAPSLDLSSTTVLAGTERDYVQGQTTASYPYAEYLPAGYASQPTRKWPLILSLHGDLHGPAGLTTQDMEPLHSINYFVLLRETPKTYVNAIMIGPTRGTQTFHWDIPQTCAFIDYLIAHYNVDTDRVSIVGQSDGGRGAWTVSSYCPEKIAAIVTGSSYPVPDGPVLNYQAFLDNNVAFHHFNRDDDGTAARLNPYIDQFLGSLLGAGNGWRDGRTPGSPVGTAHFDDSTHRWVWTDDTGAKSASGTAFAREMHVTTFPVGGHDTWTFINHDRDTLDWLFKQVKSGTTKTITSQGLGAGGTIDGAGQLVINGVDVYKGTAIPADAGTIAAAINAAGIANVTATASNVAVGTWAATTDKTAAYYVNYRYIAMAVTGNRATDVSLYMSFLNSNPQMQLSAADNGSGMTLTAVDGHNIRLGGPWDPSAIGLAGLPWGSGLPFPANASDLAQLAVIRGKFSIIATAKAGLAVSGSRLTALGLH